VRLLARLRAWDARHPIARWLLVAATAAGCAVLVLRHGAAVDRERAAWGTSVEVLVAATDLMPGVPLTPAEVTSARWPQALVTQDVLRELPAGATARQHVARGELLHHHDVVPTGGVAARLPAGTEGVSVPVGMTVVSVGDAVAVVADGVRLGSGTVVAISVVDVIGPVAVVALAPSSAPKVATASREGRAVLIVSASPPPPPPG
jgi:hypothetical protein